MEGQPPPPHQPPHHQPPQPPPDNFGYPPSSPPGYSGLPPGAYPGAYPGAPTGYPPNPYTGYMAPPPMPRKSGVPWWGWLLGGCLGVLVIGGVLCVVLGATLGARLGSAISRVANQQYVTATSTQSFTVSGAPSIVVNNGAGTVTYQAGTGSTVTVQITRRAGNSTSTDAQNDLENITASATQSGNTITITGAANGMQGLGRTQEVNFVITGPAGATLSITNQTGDVTLTGVQGVVTTNVQVGDLDVESATLADGSRLQTNVGTVTLDGQLAPGASAEIAADVGSVDVTLPASTSAHLSATTDTGDITITGWSIQPTSQGASESASGDLGTNPSGTLTIQVHTGSITLTAGS